MSKKKQPKEETELRVKIGPIQHPVHVNRDLIWTFDRKVDPNTVFRKIKEIARDDCGTVFELIHIPSNTPLVGKTANETTFDKSKLDLIKSEFTTMSKIISLFITRYYGSITLNGSPTFLMEFYPLGSIRDIIDRRKAVLTEQQASFVIHDLLCALDVLHTDHEMAHRDVRASNVFLSSDGFCKLSVFGFTRCFDPRQESILPIFVAPYWMAPEVITDEQVVFKSDIWSVAMTAFELVVGAPPRIDLTATRAMIATAQNGIDDSFPLKERYSKDFVSFIQSCAVIDRNKRPSAKESLDHPFIKMSESLDRMEIMGPLINNSDIPDNGNNADPEFKEKTQHFIEKYIAMFKHNQ